MSDLDDLEHQAARARQLCGIGQPIAAVTMALGDDAGAFLAHVPEHCREGLANHILFGIKPGDFLTCVLDNNLIGTLGKADEINRESLFGYGLFLYNAAPPESYGSPEAAAAWRGHGGWYGRELADARARARAL